MEPTFGLMLFCCHLKFFIIFEQGALCLPLTLDLSNHKLFLINSVVAVTPKVLVRRSLHCLVWLLVHADPNFIWASEAVWPGQGGERGKGGREGEGGGAINNYLQEKAMAPHSSTLAWNIPWTEEPGRLQSMGSLRVGHHWATSLSLFTFMHWRRKWQPTPVFLPGESQGRGRLVGCHLWGRRVGHDWSDLVVS